MAIDAPAPADLPAVPGAPTAPTLPMDAATIRALGYRIVDMIAGELEDPARRPVYPPPQRRDDPDFEVMSEPELSICCFRYVPPDLSAGTEPDERYLDALNQAVELALMDDGRAMVSGTELHGRRVLRACIVNHRATRAHVDATVELLREIGRATDARLRTEGARPSL